MAPGYQTRKLTDDMGLGKSVQVIARLVQEKELHKALKVGEKITSLSALPTLLIAPTSVVGNWQKEIARFVIIQPNFCKIGAIFHHCVRTNSVG